MSTPLCRFITMRSGSLPLPLHPPVTRFRCRADNSLRTKLWTASVSDLFGDDAHLSSVNLYKVLISRSGCSVMACESLRSKLLGGKKSQKEKPSTSVDVADQHYLSLPGFAAMFSQTHAASQSENPFHFPKKRNKFYRWGPGINSLLAVSTDVRDTADFSPALLLPLLTPSRSLTAPSLPLHTPSFQRFLPPLASSLASSLPPLGSTAGVRQNTSLNIPCPWKLSPGRCFRIGLLTSWQ